MDSPLIVAVLAAASIIVALGVIWRQVIRPAHQIMRRVVDFLDDWFGSAPRPGRPRRKPMPDRLNELEGTVTAVTSHVERLAAQVERLYEESLADRADLRARLEDLGRRRRRHGPP